MTSKPSMFPQPDEQAKLTEADDRTLEGRKTPFQDGRHIKRALTRERQVGLRISDDKKMQFDRLRLRTKWTYTEIFEAALDDFEKAWEAGKHRR